MNKTRATPNYRVSFQCIFFPKKPVPVASYRDLLPPNFKCYRKKYVNLAKLLPLCFLSILTKYSDSLYHVMIKYLGVTISSLKYKSSKFVIKVLESLKNEKQPSLLTFKIIFEFMTV